MRGEPLHQVCDTGAPERSQRRPDRHPSCPSRQLGDLVEGVGHVGGADEVAGPHAHGGLQRLGIGDHADAAVVRHVQGLVGVGGPRVGAVDAGDEVPQRRRGRGPQAEGSVHVHPGPVVVRARDALGERVVGAGVQVARLQHHDRRSLGGRQGLGERGRHDASLVVRGDRRGCAEAEVAKREVDAVVALGADQDGDLRAAGQPEPLDVPAGAGQHVLAGRRQAGEAGHRRPRGEADGGSWLVAPAGRAATRRPPPRRPPRPVWRNASRRSGPTRR